MDRRKFLEKSFPTVGAFAATPLAIQSETESKNPLRRLRVICVGAHPDDPESGCGGTLKLYAEQGHEVTVVYFTRGEAGIANTPHDQAAAIRSAECEAACRILGVQHQFAGQIDAAPEVTPQRAEAFAELLVKLTPDVLLTHWPLDAHFDHAMAGNLTLRAHLSKLTKAALYFFEVYTGLQTLNFCPTDYVDITSTRADKKRATFAHKSQRPDEWYPHHEEMEKFRGVECGAFAAEAFTRLYRLGKGTPARLLPPVPC